jgi:hypothetical protein
MTPVEIEKYFQYHNSNIKLLKIGFDKIRDQIKLLYRSRNRSGNYIYLLNDKDPEKNQTKKIEKSLSRLLVGIQVSWAEECIKRLLYEKNLLTDKQRIYLIEQPALDQKWYVTLKVIFCIAYDLVPIKDETCKTVKIEGERRNLGDELVDQYLELRGLITDHLVPNFSIRNKVQHGEWEYAFKPKYSATFSQDITDKLNKENIIATTSRYSIVNAFYQMLVDLGRFKSNRFALNSIMTPFEYYYKSYMRKIKFEIDKIDNPNLNFFISELVQKDMRGQQYKLQ